MKKFLLSNTHFLVGLMLTLSLLWPLFKAPFFTHHDDVQIIRVYEMDKCFKDHQIPCRWVPDLGGLYGYPLFNFYAPLPYYFGELIYLVTGNLIWSVKVMFAVSFIGSFIFMYLLAKKFWGKLGGSLSATFYAFAPYHAVDFYVRGAMGEMWGLMFFPAIFWSLTKLEEKTSIGNLLLVGIFMAFLITSHNLSAFIFLPFSLVFSLILFLKNKNKKFIWFVLTAFILATLLSAFYLLPAIYEKNLVHLETTVEGYFSYTEHFKGFKKLILERSWGYGSSIREVPGGEKDNLSYQIGWAHLLGLLLALYTAKYAWKKNRWISLVILFATGTILVSVFMVNPRSQIIWVSINSLKYLQFPWRFLLLIIFFISFISGSFSQTFLKDKKYIWVLLFSLVVLINFFYFKPENFIQTNDKKLLSGQNWDKQIKRSIFDYLPIYAKEPPAELADTRYKILTGDIKVYDFFEGTNWITFKADSKTHSIVRLSQYYFPDWKIFVDGKEIAFDYKSSGLGLMTIILGKGNHEVWARLYDTHIRTLSNLLSLIAFITVTVLFLLQFKSIRSWILYYRKRIG